MNRVIIGFIVLIILIVGLFAFISRNVGKIKLGSNFNRTSPLPSFSPLPTGATPSLFVLPNASLYPSASSTLPQSGILPATGL